MAQGRVRILRRLHDPAEVPVKKAPARRWLVATTVAFTTLFVADAAVAQVSLQGRARQRIERREAKAQQLQPPTKGKAEGSVGWLETSFFLPKLARGFGGFHAVWGGFALIYH